MGDHGAWLQVKYIGASQVWLHEWAVKTFSRERQPVHVCRGGTLRCKVRERAWPSRVGVPHPCTRARAPVLRGKTQGARVEEGCTQMS